MKTRTVGLLTAGLVGCLMVFGTINTPEASVKAQLFVSWLYPTAGSLDYGQSARAVSAVHQSSASSRTPVQRCAPYDPLVVYFRQFTTPEQFDSVTAAVLAGNFPDAIAFRNASREELLQAVRCADPRSCESGPAPMCSKHGSCGPGMRCGSLDGACGCVPL